jgi:ATP-dependent helicase HrpA
VGEDGRQLGMGRDLAALKRQLSPQAEAVLQQEVAGERHTGWTMGDLEEMMEIERGGQALVGYPALADAGGGENAAVTLQVFDSPEKAREVHRGGVRRLLAIAFRDRIRDLERALSKDILLGPLKEDVIAAALDRAFLAESLPVAQKDFARRVDEGRSRFNLIAQEISRTATGILQESGGLEKKISSLEKAFPRETTDIRQQVSRLLGSGWLAKTPWARVQHFPRYLKAASLRLDKLRADPARDARQSAGLASLEQAYRRELAARAKYGPPGAELEQFGWLLEELRVSLFAQELRTPVPVSAKRLAKLWQTVRR